jgi:hypothetical protein
LRRVYLAGQVDRAIARYEFDLTAEIFQRASHKRSKSFSTEALEPAIVGLRRPAQGAARRGGQPHFLKTAGGLAVEQESHAVMITNAANAILRAVTSRTSTALEFPVILKT